MGIFAAWLESSVILIAGSIETGGSHHLVFYYPARANGQLLPRKWIDPFLHLYFSSWVKSCNDTCR